MENDFGNTSGCTKGYRPVERDACWGLITWSDAERPFNLPQGCVRHRERGTCAIVQGNHLTETRSAFEAGSYLRLINSCITQLNGLLGTVMRVKKKVTRGCSKAVSGPRPWRAYRDTSLVRDCHSLGPWRKKKRGRNRRAKTSRTRRRRARRREGKGLEFKPGSHPTLGLVKHSGSFNFQHWRKTM